MSKKHEKIVRMISFIKRYGLLDQLIKFLDNEKEEEWFFDGDYVGLVMHRFKWYENRIMYTRYYIDGAELDNLIYDLRLAQYQVDDIQDVVDAFEYGDYVWQPGPQVHEWTPEVIVRAY